MTAVSGRRRRVVKDKLGDRRRLRQGLAARIAHTCRLQIRLTIVARRPIDCLAVFTASAASIAIIVNALCLQSGFRHRTDTDGLEGFVSTLQKPQEFLNSEGMRLRRKIDSAV